MNKKSNYTLCPICGAADITKVFKVKDSSVSKKEFELLHCNNCLVRFTQDPPSENEIGDFYKSENYISHTDTSRGLVNQLYRFVRARSITRKRKLVESEASVRKGKLLDVGSGTGYFAASMQKAGWEVEGLEPDEGAREVALKQHSVILKPVETLFDLKENAFDLITLWHVLEHVHDPKKYIATFKKLLKSNGKLIIAVPNYISYDSRAYQEFWAAYDVPRHLYHFNPSAMQWLISNAGMKIDELKPMWFDSFYVSLLSSRYKNGNTNWIGALWTGLISNFNAIGDVKKCSSVIYIISK